jgi:hypothetical protein
VTVCKKFEVMLTTNEINNIINSYPGRGSDAASGSFKVNIYPIYDAKYNLKAYKLY